MLRSTQVSAREIHPPRGPEGCSGNGGFRHGRTRPIDELGVNNGLTAWSIRTCTSSDWRREQEQHAKLERKKKRANVIARDHTWHRQPVRPSIVVVSTVVVST